MILSKAISLSDIELLGLSKAMTIEVNKEMIPYLVIHRKKTEK